MSTLSKALPCPRCDTAEHLAIYTYESGWRHVECDECYYLGPGEGSKAQAIASHNEALRRRTAMRWPADVLVPLRQIPERGG